MLENLELMKMRNQVVGNSRQQNRMIIDKLRSMRKALLYSYQSAWVRKDAFMEENTNEWVRALINPDKVKFDYDEKIISIEYEHGFQPGDTFEWGKNTNSHWIILKTENTELAYLRANIRRCCYLTAKDPVTKQSYSQWCAIRGPVETKINTIQKSGIVADVPNLTLDIYMKDNELNRRTFERYQNFKYEDRFWKVQAPDYISTPGVLEIVAEEDYDCNHDERVIEIGEYIPPENDYDNAIEGDTYVKPLQEYIFTVRFQQPETTWSITLPAEKNKEIDDVLEYEILEDGSFKVKWTSMLSGSYIVHYGELERTIIVESLF